MYKKEWYARTFLLKLIENISFAAIPQKAFMIKNAEAQRILPFDREGSEPR